MKEYIAQVKYHKAFNGKWNTILNGDCDMRGRHKTLQSAKEAIANEIRRNNGQPRVEHNGPIAFVVDEQSAKDFTVVDSRIMCREVSPWEAVVE